MLLRQKTPSKAKPLQNAAFGSEFESFSKPYSQKDEIAPKYRWLNLYNYLTISQL